MEKFYTFIFTLIWVKLAVNGRCPIAETFLYFCFINTKLFSENNYTDICMNFDKNHIANVVSQIYTRAYKYMIYTYGLFGNQNKNLIRVRLSIQ